MEMTAHRMAKTRGRRGMVETTGRTMRRGGAHASAGGANIKRRKRVDAAEVGKRRLTRRDVRATMLSGIFASLPKSSGIELEFCEHGETSRSVHGKVWGRMTISVGEKRVKGKVVTCHIICICLAREKARSASALGTTLYLRLPTTFSALE